jgi:CDP-diacylglycerol--glycerol-3-phosphate 3-phosphatidyltransferase
MPAQTYPHDRLLAATVLKLLPSRVRPNHLTVLRMLLTPLVVWSVYAHDHLVSIPLFLAVAFTDALDGSLARVRDRVTDWGKVWDPVADKLLIGSVAVVLLLQEFPPELAVVIFGLEAMFLLGGYFRKRQGMIVSANLWGKFKMLLQVVGVVLFLLSLQTGLDGFAYASYAIFGVATLSAVASLFSYGL